jgi:hypothetical protein
MKRVRFTCDWCTDSELHDRVKRAYIFDEVSYNFSLTLDNDYDLLVSINKPIYNKTVPVLGVLMEPSWFLGDRLFSIYDTCDHVLSYNKTTQFKNNIYYPGLLPMQLNYDSGEDLNYYIKNNFTKTKTCSMIVSRTKNSHREDVLYNKRVQLAEQILQTDLPIDIYGKGWDAYITKDSRVKGSLDLNSKYVGLQDYKFSIAIENTVEGDYFTEKVTDCLLVNTIPIYYGCKFINNFFLTPLALGTCNSVEEISNILKASENYNFYNTDKQLLGNKFNLLIAISKYIEKL